MKKFFLFILSIIYSTNVFPGLLPDTLIYMGNRTYIKAKDLKENFPIPIYNVQTHRFEEEKRVIENVTINKTKNIILLETEDDSIAVGPEQKIFNLKTKKCIPAEEFKVGDMLFSPEEGALEIINIEKKELDEKIELYEFSIKDGNLFLILSQNRTLILIHNFPFIEVFLNLETVKEVFTAAVEALGIATLVTLFAKDSQFNLDEAIKENPDLKDVVKDAKKPKRRKGKTSGVFEKDGGKEQKDVDFDKLNKGPVRHGISKDGEHIRFGTTEWGETIVDRDFSSDSSGNKPTLEIQKGKYNNIKIRYN